MNIKSLDLLSYGPDIQNPKLWLFTYYNLYFNKHENISKINTTFTNLKFSVVHFMTMLCEKNVIEKFIKNGELLLLLDAYGHSPIYYPIKFKHQEITDMYINYILEVLEKEPNSFKLSILLESIQNDLATIIINASPNLDIFLSSTFLNQKTPVYFGNPNDDFPIIEISKFTSMGFDEFSSQQGDKVPLKIKQTPFMLPFGIGSPQSKELLNAIITCKNLDIYRTEIIQNFILKKWGVISLYVYLYTALLWGNILVIYFALKTELSIFIILSYLSI